MWHEARKQERKIRGMIVDFRKRAERRQDFYEKIKADPTQFMQVHGRKCKIHLDSAIAAAGDGSAIIVPWQGQKDNLIDRFDVRAHLDYIPPVQKSNEPEELTVEERQCNYERYRILAQNDFLNLTEEKFLHQLYLEEQFGANAPTEITNPNSGGPQSNTNKKKPSTGSGAAIGYNYEDNDSSSAPFSHILSAPVISLPQSSNVEDEESESDLDMDVSIEITKLDTTQAHELNGCGRNYGMLGNDFFSYLHKDADEAEALRMAREEEAEKIMLSGRKSRRERRAQRERRFIGRPLSPPSYAAKVEPQEKENESADSRSPSPENSGKITYITSFGGEDELQPHSKISINLNKPFGASSTMSYADKVKENLSKLKEINDIQKGKKSPESPKVPKQYLRSRTRTRSRSRSYKRRSRSRSIYKRSGSRNYRRSRSRDRSYRSRRRRASSSSDSRGSSIRRKSRSRSLHRRRDYSRSRSPRRSKLRYQTNRRRRTSTSYSESSKSKSPERSKSISKSKTAINITTEHTSQVISSEKPFSFGEYIVPSNSGFNPSESCSLPSSSSGIGQLSKLPISSQLSTPITFNKPTLSPIRPQQSPKPLQFNPQPSSSPMDIEVPIKRYYGRRKNEESSSNSEEENSTEEETDNNKIINENSNSESFLAVALNSGGVTGAGNSGTNNTNSSTYDAKGQGKINPRDRLKRKMQILLNKQYKADKKAEIERTERQIQQQQEREDEMRELALKLRRRQRELRHKYGTPSPIANSSESESEKQPTVISISAAPIINKDALKLIKEKSRSKSKSRSRTPREKDRRRRSNERIFEMKRCSPNRNRGSGNNSGQIGRGLISNSNSSNRRRRSSSTDYKRDLRKRSRSSSRHRAQQYNKYRQRSRSRDRRITSSYRDRDRDRYNDRRRDELRNYNSRNHRSRSRSKSHGDRNYNRRPRDRSRDNNNMNRQRDRNNDNQIGSSNISSPKVFSSTKRLVDY